MHPTEAIVHSLLRRRLLRAGVAMLGLAAQRVAGANEPAPSAASNAPGRALQAGSGRVLRVGPGHRYASPSQAARAARDGDVVEIEAGDYVGDVAVWRQARLAIRSVGGTVRMIAAGQAADGKAIWVIRRGAFEIEGVEFHGARVPHRNGAGIRFEGGQLHVRNCRFIDNENGILTGNDEVSQLALEGCEFEGRSQTADGFTHNLYVGRIARFEMRGCWSHHANAGHLVKTRARESFLYCNRLTDEPGGRASYELDCPNGGTVVLLGNLIAQEPTNQNNTLVSFGAEGYRWPQNRLVLAHNTFVNRGPVGVFVRVYEGVETALLENNLFAGEGLLDGVRLPPQRGNYFASRSDFVDPDHFDYRLRAQSALRGKAAEASRTQAPTHPALALALAPEHEYAHPAALRALEPAPLGAPPGTSPGAFQS